MFLWAAFHDILWVQGASQYVGILSVLPVLSIPNSISTYRLDNGIAVPNRKGTKRGELLPKVSHPGTDIHRSGVRFCEWGDPLLIVVGQIFLGA